jgi:nicotinamidase/pyrazinamidase
MLGIVIVDVQKDFEPGGALAVEQGDQVVPALVDLVHDNPDAPVFFTRDWHPVDHDSFASYIQRTGEDILEAFWPDHCIAGTPGAEFDPEIQKLVDETVQEGRGYIISKGMLPEREQVSYSGYTPELQNLLSEQGITTLLVGGLATDYCVKHTVKDLLYNGYKVWLFEDGIRAVNINQEDEADAIEEMRADGAEVV